MLAGHIPPTMGGEEIHVWELSKRLAARGTHVTLIGSAPITGDAPYHETLDNLDIYRLSTPKTPYIRTIARNIQTIRLFKALHKQEPFDLIHAHQTIRLPLASNLSEKGRIPFILTEHGSILSWSKKHSVKPLLKSLITRPEKIICASRELEQVCQEVGARRTLTIPNAVDTETFSPPSDPTQRENTRASLGYNNEDVVILSLRRLVPKNGVQYLIEASRRVISQEPKAKFLIVGDGPLRSQLEERVDTYGLQANIKFLGTIPNHKIPKIISAVDLGVFPSLAEATSIAALEVMSVGKPVVSSDVGGLPEIIINEETGLLVPFNLTRSSYEDPGLKDDIIDSLSQAILRLVTDDYLREQLGTRAREYIHSNNSWTRYVEKIESIYTQLKGGENPL